MAKNNNNVDYQFVTQVLLAILIALLGWLGRSFDVRLCNVEDDVSQIMRVVCPLDGTEVASVPSNTTGF